MHYKRKGHRGRHKVNVMDKPSLALPGQFGKQADLLRKLPFSLVRSYALAKEMQRIGAN